MSHTVFWFRKMKKKSIIVEVHVGYHNMIVEKEIFIK